ncbi:hypothetical protein GALMADRAFT_1247083 [Galerina marginata CBS 339.88]|uniref:Uncharacterized protein n=1 Tax=Galerina marginata (strain CBS 339.88) TaxID=685588 RepID=A0A067T8Y0_GALM3|nr:hypothetical protein GALMADRAFT_1247083 [Galerina marginata CBS 339.88]
MPLEHHLPQNCVPSARNDKAMDPDTGVPPLHPSNLIVIPVSIPELPSTHTSTEMAPRQSSPFPENDTLTDPTDCPAESSSQLPALANTVSGAEGDGVLSTGGAAVGPRGKIMHPLKKKDAKGLCSVEWCKLNPTGTVSQFNIYWTSIKDSPAAECFAPPNKVTPRRTTRKTAAVAAAAT